MRFTLAWDGGQVDRAITKIRGVETLVSDLTPVWPEITQLFYDIEKEQFETEGGAGESGPWEPLSPDYAAWKANNYGNTGILERTGRLKASLTGEGGGFEDVAPMTLRIGSGVFYGVYHQSTAPRSRLPRRPVIDIADRNKRRFLKVIQAHLLKQVEEE